MADFVVARGANNASSWTQGQDTSRRRRGDAANRALDILLAVCAVLFLTPLMLALALAVKLQDGGPVLFAHERIGRNGHPFMCLKFRSMVLDSQERLEELLAKDPLARAQWSQDHKLKVDPRITRLGAFLRRSSLDELPQFINVLRGDMSVVGPRPIVSAEICKYGRQFRHYCSVKPGITGLWQVNGRSDVSYRRRVAMDTIYARRKSIIWDIKLLAMTVPAVLFGEGSY